MARFKEGDVITPKVECQGFYDITVMRVEDNKYRCRIINGTVTIPIQVADNNYDKVR